MTSYAWSIDKVSTIAFFGGQPDVVSQIAWHMTAIAGSVLKAEYYGITNIPTVNLEDFVPYSQLTNTDMIAWLEQLVDVNLVKATLDQQLQAMQVPQTIVQVR